MNAPAPLPAFASIPPEAGDRFDVAVEDAVRVAAYELAGGAADAPVLIWAHANGFAAGSYLPFLQRLAAGFRVFAYDVRGQGGSSVPPQPWTETLTFDRFARDLEVVTWTVRDRAGAGDLYFAGHSFSAAAMYHLGGNLGFAPWRRVTTFDATMLPDDEPDLVRQALSGTDERVARAARRRHYWPDHATYTAAMGRPGAFNGWAPGMMAAHGRATIRPRPPGADADGGGAFELCCAPEVEAAIYRNVMNNAPYRGLPRFPVPAHLVAADPACGGTWVGAVQHAAARHLRDARLTVMAGAGHLMPFESPAACAALVLDMLRG